MEIAVLGVGAVGARAARQLVDASDVDRVLLAGGRRARLEGLTGSLGDRSQVVADPFAAAPAVVLIAGPSGTHLDAARRALSRNCHVVSTSDDRDEVDALLSLDAEARERDRTVAVGAAFSPGMSCVLAAHAATRFDAVDEIHVSRVGTGGPACARQHHVALGRPAVDWRDGGWLERRAGSGRELAWFPDPIGARDCYRAGLPDAMLLVPAFPGVDRVTARLAANRRDRLTSRLPMLRRPHAEGGPGACRVEVRGEHDGEKAVEVLGAIDRPAVASGAVAALVARWAANGDLRRAGAAGLAELVDPLRFLKALADIGVKAAIFEGS